MVTSWPNWVGPFVTILAALAALIFARQQVKIAREKLRYDLFEKRYEIYQATKKVLGHILGQADFDKQDSEFIRASFVKMRESRYILEKDLQSYLLSIEADCQAYFELCVEHKRLGEERAPINIADHVTTFRGLAAQISEKTKKFHEIVTKELDNKFETALAFDLALVARRRFNRKGVAISAAVAGAILYPTVFGGWHAFPSAYDDIRWYGYHLFAFSIQTNHEFSVWLPNVLIGGVTGAALAWFGPGLVARYLRWLRLS